MVSVLVVMLVEEVILLVKVVAVIIILLILLVIVTVAVASMVLWMTFDGFRRVGFVLLRAVSFEPNVVLLEVDPEQGRQRLVVVSNQPPRLVRTLGGAQLSQHCRLDILHVSVDTIHLFQKQLLLCVEAAINRPLRLLLRVDNHRLRFGGHRWLTGVDLAHDGRSS